VIDVIAARRVTPRCATTAHAVDAMSRSEIDRLEGSLTGTGDGVYEGIETLNTSTILFC
jgi:hypothetical protein